MCLQRPQELWCRLSNDILDKQAKEQKQSFMCMDSTSQWEEMGLWINSAGITKYPEGGEMEARTSSSSIPAGLQTTVKRKTEEFLEDNVSDYL